MAPLWAGGKYKNGEGSGPRPQLAAEAGGATGTTTTTGWAAKGQVTGSTEGPAASGEEMGQRHKTLSWLSLVHSNGGQHHTRRCKGRARGAQAPFDCHYKT